MKIEIILTDASGKPLAGASVTESNTSLDGSKTQENTKTIIANSSGAIQDCICKGGITTTPQKRTSDEAREHYNNTALTFKSTQVLTVKIGNETYTATWTRTLSNVGNDGRLNTQMNSKGVNYVYTHTDPKYEQRK